jgi:hypothetical protein
MQVVARGLTSSGRTGPADIGLVGSDTALSEEDHAHSHKSTPRVLLLDRVALTFDVNIIEPMHFQSRDLEELHVEKSKFRQVPEYLANEIGLRNQHNLSFEMRAARGSLFPTHHRPSDQSSPPASSVQS